MTDKLGKMIYVWGDPTIVVSDFDPADGMTPYGSKSVALTSHYDDDFENAGSLECDNCLYLSEEQIPELIEALKEFTK